MTPKFKRVFNVDLQFKYLLRFVKSSKVMSTCEHINPLNLNVYNDDNLEFIGVLQNNIIDYNQKNYSIKIKKDFLIVPHPRMSARNFVLLPLFQICNHWKHPKTKQKITELMSKLPLSSITAIKVM